MELLINTLEIKENYSKQEINELCKNLGADFEAAFLDHNRAKGNLDLFLNIISLNHLKVSEKNEVDKVTVRNFMRFLNLIKENPFKNPILSDYNESVYVF